MQTKKSYLNIGAGLLFLLFAVSRIAYEVLRLTDSEYSESLFEKAKSGISYVLGLIPAVCFLILGIMFLVRASNYLIPILFLVIAVVTVLPFIIWELPDLIDNKSSSLWAQIIAQVVIILPYLFAAGVTAKGVGRKKGHGGTLDSWPVPGTIAFTIGLISFAAFADGLCDQFKLIGVLLEGDAVKEGVGQIFIIINQFCGCFFIPLALLIGCKWFAKSEVREARPAPVPYNGFNAPAPAYVPTPAPAPAQNFAPPQNVNPAPAQTFTLDTVTVKPSGAPRSLGSSEKLYWVFAMQIGRPPKPIASISAAFFLAAGSIRRCLAW